jgi:hypothetical protein
MDIVETSRSLRFLATLAIQELSQRIRKGGAKNAKPLRVSNLAIDDWQLTPEALFLQYAF